MKAGNANTVSNLLALLLNIDFGRNSPVKSTMIVESIVSAGTVIPGSNPEKIVLSNNFATRIP